MWITWQSTEDETVENVAEHGTVKNMTEHETVKNTAEHEKNGEHDRT